MPLEGPGYDPAVVPAGGDRGLGTGLGRSRAVRPLLGRTLLIGRFAQLGTVLSDGLVDVVDEVLPQMEAVSDLGGLRCSRTGAVGVGAGTIPADHFHLGMFGQPGGQRARFPVGQQVDHRAGVHVHQHGAVGSPLAGGKVVHAERAHLTGRAGG